MLRNQEKRRSYSTFVCAWNHYHLCIIPSICELFDMWSMTFIIKRKYSMASLCTSLWIWSELCACITYTRNTMFAMLFFLIGNLTNVQPRGCGSEHLSTFPLAFVWAQHDIAPYDAYGYGYEHGYKDRRTGDTTLHFQKFRTRIWIWASWFFFRWLLS